MTDEFIAAAFAILVLMMLYAMFAVLTDIRDELRKRAAAQQSEERK